MCYLFPAIVNENVLEQQRQDEAPFQVPTVLSISLCMCEDMQKCVVLTLSP